MQVELEALRARAQQEQRERQQQQAAAAAAAAAERAGSSAGAGPSGRPPGEEDDETTALLKRTVKVTWDPAVGKQRWSAVAEQMPACMQCSLCASTLPIGCPAV